MSSEGRIRGGTCDILTPTIFHEQWWLDIATDGRFNVVEVVQNGKRIGWLPYVVQKKFGLTFCIPPRMTHFLGPAVDGGDGNADAQAFRRAEITQDLVTKLPPATIYHYRCHRDITDVFAFQQENFSASVVFTQELAPRPIDDLWASMAKKKRHQIRKAKDIVTPVTIDDPQEFWKFYDSNIENRGIRNFFREDQVTRCIEQCHSRQCGRIYAAKSKDGSIDAAIWCIWDKTSSYFYMGTRTAQAHYGAVSLLVWQAIQDAAKRGLFFDFDCFFKKESVAFFRGFGGRVVPRFTVTRTTGLGRLLWEGRKSLAANPYLR